MLGIFWQVENASAYIYSSPNYVVSIWPLARSIQTKVQLMRNDDTIAGRRTYISSLSYTTNQDRGKKETFRFSENWHSVEHTSAIHRKHSFALSGLYLEQSCIVFSLPQPIRPYHPITICEWIKAT